MHWYSYSPRKASRAHGRRGLATFRYCGENHLQQGHIYPPTDKIQSGIHLLLRGLVERSRRLPRILCCPACRHRGLGALKASSENRAIDIFKTNPVPHYPSSRHEGQRFLLPQSKPGQALRHDTQAGTSTLDPGQGNTPTPQPQFLFSSLLSFATFKFLRLQGYGSAVIANQPLRFDLPPK